MFHKIFLTVIAGLAVMNAFVFWCCIKVGAEEDERMGIKYRGKKHCSVGGQHHEHKIIQ